MLPFVRGLSCPRGTCETVSDVWETQHGLHQLAQLCVLAVEVK